MKLKAAGPRLSDPSHLESSCWRKGGGGLTALLLNGAFTSNLMRWSEGVGSHRAAPFKTGLSDLKHDSKMGRIYISPEEELFFYAVICAESHRLTSPVLFRVPWYNRHLGLHSPTFFFSSFLILFRCTIEINMILPVFELPGSH